MISVLVRSRGGGWIWGCMVEKAYSDMGVLDMLAFYRFVLTCDVIVCVGCAIITEEKYNV